MAKLTIEVQRCSECPCLRNSKYGFKCFLRDSYSLDVFNLYCQDLPEWCPALEEDN